MAAGILIAVLVLGTLSGAGYGATAIGLERFDGLLGNSASVAISHSLTRFAMNSWHESRSN